MILFRSISLMAFSVLVLNSCICTQKITSRASIRKLNGAKGFTLCETPQGKRAKAQFNAYYGYPLQDKKDIIQQYDTDTSSYSRFKYRGQFGVNIGYYARSFGRFSNARILGYGLDYSFQHYDLAYKSALTEELQTDTYTHHRIAFGISHMIWVTHRTIGYGTGQFGVTFNEQTRYSTLNTSIPGSSLRKDSDAFYRLGLGAQLYLAKGVAIYGEGGYGGGAYGRVGMVFWF